MSERRVLLVMRQCIEDAQRTLRLLEDTPLATCMVNTTGSTGPASSQFPPIRP